eukprot:12919550-Prorocentrum_lima.AAC.1
MQQPQEFYAQQQSSSGTNITMKNSVNLSKEDCSLVFKLTLTDGVNVSAAASDTCTVVRGRHTQEVHVIP